MKIRLKHNQNVIQDRVTENGGARGALRWILREVIFGRVTYYDEAMWEIVSEKSWHQADIGLLPDEEKRTICIVNNDQITVPVGFRVTRELNGRVLIEEWK